MMFVELSRLMLACVCRHPGAAGTAELRGSLAAHGGAAAGRSAQPRSCSGPAAGGGERGPAEHPRPGRPRRGDPAERGAGPLEGGAGGRRRRLRERRAVRSEPGGVRGPAGACSRAGRRAARRPPLGDYRLVSAGPEEPGPGRCLSPMEFT